MVWDISRPFNSADTKTVDGFEVAVQHLFGDQGLVLLLTQPLLKVMLNLMSIA